MEATSPSRSARACQAALPLPMGLRLVLWVCCYCWLFSDSCPACLKALGLLLLSVVFRLLPCVPQVGGKEHTDTASDRTTRSAQEKSSYDSGSKARTMVKEPSCVQSTYHPEFFGSLSLLGGQKLHNFLTIFLV